MRLRFFAPIKELTHQTAARLTQIDYDREMALVLAEPTVPGAAEIYAVARIMRRSRQRAGRVRDHRAPRHDRQGLRLAADAAPDRLRPARGIGEMFGDVLRENRRMLGLCRSLGFEETADPDDPAVKLVRLRL